MKQVEKVSIGGYAYTMESVAAQSARQYLEEIANHYAGEGSEVLEGIEERMAELLNERKGTAEVIRSSDVDAVIAILGRPETIDRYSPEPPSRKRKAAGDNAKSTALELCGTVARFLLAAIGIIFIITGFSGIFAGGIVLFGHQIFGTDSIFAFIVEMLSSQTWAATIMEVLWIKVLAVLVYFLPFIGLLYAGIMLTFNLRSPKWHPGLIIFVLWLLCIIALVILASIAAASLNTMPIDL